MQFIAVEMDFGTLGVGLSFGDLAMHQDSRSKLETVLEVVDLFVDLWEVVWEAGVWVVRGLAGLLEVG